MQASRTIKFWQGLVLVFMAGCSGATPGKSVPAMPPEELVRMGADLYEQNCATCHLGGESSAMFPALRGSATVMGNPDRLILVILKGQQGVSVVDGKKLNGIMPAQGYLTDVEVAAISTYVRRQFGGAQGTVQPSAVAELRE